MLTCGFHIEFCHLVFSVIVSDRDSENLELMESRCVAFPVMLRHIIKNIFCKFLQKKNILQDCGFLSGIKLSGKKGKSINHRLSN